MLNRCIIELRPSTGWTAFMIAIAVFLACSALRAQSRQNVNGKMTSLTGQELVVETGGGPAMVKLNDKTVIRGELPIKFPLPECTWAPLRQSNRMGLSVRRACMFSVKINGARARDTGRSTRCREAASP